jgi:O-Antigen ligase
VLGVVAVGAVVGLAASWGTISDKVSQQWDVFTHPGGGAAVAAAPTSSHLISGSGPRYDLWRVAWKQFNQHPLDGVGAGNFTVSYFRERRQSEDVRQPHSIELQTLGELGLVGGLALLAFLGGVYYGLAGRRRVSRTDLTARALTVGATGAFTAWLAHTSVDWMSLMPGMTGIALCGAAVLVGDAALRRGASRRRLALPVFVGVVLVVAVGAAFLVRQTLADRYRLDGQATLAAAPQQAIRDANKALAYDDDLISAYYLKAAAYARLGDYGSSRAVLLAATRKEPHAWLPWALVGDLALRARRFEDAGAAYARAHALNPRNAQIAKAAADPRAALALQNQLEQRARQPVEQARQP